MTEVKEVARRWFEIGNRKDPQTLDEILAADFVNHTPPPGIPGDREGYRRFYAMMCAGLPDFQITPEAMIAEGDTVATRWTVRGTHSGELMGAPPTGNRVEMRGITIDQVANGMVVAQWEVADNLTLMQQIGALPSP